MTTIFAINQKVEALKNLLFWIKNADQQKLLCAFVLVFTKHFQMKIKIE
jgi:hypothetical protein